MATTTNKSPQKKTANKPATKAVKASSKTVSKKSPTKKTVKKIVKKTSVTPKNTQPKMELKSKNSSIVSGTKDRLKKLNSWNWIMALLFAGQAAALLVLAEKYYYSVTTNFQTNDVLVSSGGDSVKVSAVKNLFDLNIVYLLFAMLVISAVSHLILAAVMRRKYDSQLNRGFNKFRWLQYSLISSLGLLSIGLVIGVSDVSTMLLIVGSVFIVNFANLLVELDDGNGYRTRIPQIIKWIGTLLPWLVFAEYIKGTYQYGDGGVELFVLILLGSVFALNIASLVNARLVSNKTGRWSDYFYGEENYILLSLVIQAAITWQIFAGLLR